MFKGTVETLEIGVTYIQSSGVILVLLFLTLNIFHTFFYCFYC